MLISAALCAAGGAFAAVAIRNPTVEEPKRLPVLEVAPRIQPATACLHCGLDAPPLNRSA